MKIKIHYGQDSQLEFHLKDESLLHIHGQDAAQNLTEAELPKAVFAALESPIGFPPLRECLLDGDHVVIPIAPGIPHIETILKSVLEYLFTGPKERQPEHITILRTHADEVNGTPSLAAILPDVPALKENGDQKRVEICTHHEDKKEEQAMLGVDETNETLVINRRMFDADFVLPIGFFLPKGTPGHVGIHTPVYPAFSDSLTHKRFQHFGPQMHATQHELMHQLEHEIAEVTRQLGVLCMIQVVPGIPTYGTSNIAKILAGDYHELENDGYSQYQDLWTLVSEKRPDVVLALLSGPESCSWQWVMNALVHAARIAQPENGIIVLASELSGQTEADLPRSLQIYRQVQNPETAEKYIRREELSDESLAIEALQVLANYRVFFLSRLNDELLEDLNIMPLSDSGELERLIENSGTVTILPDAHRIIS